MTQEQEARLDEILGNFLVENSGEPEVLVDIQVISNAKKEIGYIISLALSAREKEIEEAIEKLDVFDVRYIRRNDVLSLLRSPKENKPQE